MRTILGITLALAACNVGKDDPQPQPPDQPRLDRPAMVAFHMRRHFDDLRDVERLLIAGKLDEAKTRAFLLTKPAPDAGLVPWQRDSSALTAAGNALVEAPGLDEACRREARVAEACAWCHLHTQKLPVFAKPPEAPKDDGSPTARMARHQWAVDWMWEGLVAPTDGSWRTGMEVLAATPLPYSPVTDAPLLANRLQALARGALGHDPTETLDDRARTYGELLVTCAACHRTLPPRRS